MTPVSIILPVASFACVVVLFSSESYGGPVVTDDSLDRPSPGHTNAVSPSQDQSEDLWSFEFFGYMRRVPTTDSATLERQLMSSLKSTRDVTWNSSVDHLLRVRAIRRMVRSADALVGVRYRDIGEVIDFLRPLGGLGLDQSTVDNYLVEMTLLVERFDQVVPRYADLMASSDDRQASRLRSAIVDLVNIDGAIDDVNHRLVSELGEHGHTELREAINRAAFATVHAPPPVASLVSELKAIDSQLSPEERAAVETVWADFLEQETTIKSRLVASLGQWESVEATLRRVADAERNGRIREWRSWGILDHPSIPLWREHTQLAGRAWLEVSRIFSDERCAELPIHIGVALRLLDRGKMQ